MPTSPAPAAAASPSKDALADFILSFAQALLRAGYYFPEHPQAQRAKEGLYRRFQNLFQGRGELTLLLQQLGEATSVLVEGALAEPQKLGALMPAGMADVYAPRLAQFLERKDLVSLTLKERMAEDEFSRFIDVMSEPGGGGLDADAKERFLAHLRESGISHFSLVFKEDVITSDRKLPWRAHLAISRLRKDLTHVPIFHDLDAAGLRALKREVLHDVLRPVARADLLAVILMNSDLAATREASAEEIETELAQCIPDRLVLPTAHAALEHHLADADAEAEPRQRRALLTLLLHPRPQDLDGLHALLRQLFDQGLVELDRLPADLKAQIRLERDADRFLAEREAVLQRLEQASTPGAYRHEAAALARLVPELLRRGLHDEVLALVTMLRGHEALGGERAPAANATLAQLAAADVATELEHRFIASKKEDRITLGLVFQALGDFGRPHLARILEETEDAWVRKNAAEVLIRMGPSGAQAVLDALARGRLRAEAIAGLLMVFGELGADAPPIREGLRFYARHVSPRVRTEAAWALCRIGGDDGEALFIHLLDDPAPEVQQRALRCLRAARCKSGLARVLTLAGRAEHEPALQALEPQLYAALPDLSEAWDGHGGEAEALLVARLQNGVPHGLLRRARRPLGDDALIAVVDALGAVGTTPALEALKDLARHVKEPVGPHVTKAIERIEARLYRTV